jgi:hypothetical protein
MLLPSRWAAGRSRGGMGVKYWLIVTVKCTNNLIVLE